MTIFVIFSDEVAYGVLRDATLKPGITEHLAAELICKWHYGLFVHPMATVYYLYAAKQKILRSSSRFV